MSPNSTEKILDVKSKGIEFAKSKAFDIIALAIIVAMSLLSLGFVELRSVTLTNVLNILVECVPLYFAATLLSSNYYNKGTYSAKLGKNFKEASSYFSEIVNSLTGAMIAKLHEFCYLYNKKALSKMQEDLLMSVGIPYDLYDQGNDKIKPLKSMTEDELLQMYNDRVTKVILKCNTLKVKGINVNIILGNNDCVDVTDLGRNEKQLKTMRIAGYATTYALVTISMSLIGVKDIMQWGWMGAALTLFKVLYIASGAYMKYFNGYEDIDVNIVNYLYRKTDVIKEFRCWYDEQAD